jgi:hypothetical protein
MDAKLGLTVRNRLNKVLRRILERDRAEAIKNCRKLRNMKLHNQFFLASLSYDDYT